MENLISLSKKESRSVAKNIGIIIQDLIDDVLTPESFSKKVDKLLKANSQPCFIGFLKVKYYKIKQNYVYQKFNF